MPYSYPLDLDAIMRLAPGAIEDEGNMEVIVKYNGDIKRIEESTGGTVEILNESYAIVTININQVWQLYNYKEVEYIELPKMLMYSLRRSLNSACISPVQRPTGLNLSGAGTIVGIIDSGIDYTHPTFINEDGTSRIISIWDQLGEGEPPIGFRSGVEYSNEQINIALQSENPYAIVPSRDYAGHGTAVAGIAAGNGRGSGGMEKGIATEASLIVVKLGSRGNENFARTTEIMRAIKYIWDKAESMDMPVAINLSYGTNNGSHLGNSLFEEYIDDMAQKWKTVIVVATGNEGSAGHHFYEEVEEGETVKAFFITTGNVERIYITLWKNFVDGMTFELISPSGKTTGIIRPTQRSISMVMDGVRVSAILVQPTHYRTEQEVYFSFQGIDMPIPEGDWSIVIRGVDIVDGRINMWLPTVEDVTRDTFFLQPSVNTTLTIPSTAQNVIAVGGYDARIGISADFSGRGYTERGMQVKPDFVAPAVDITTALTGGGYDSFTGTSMAAPFGTGSAALMMQWGIVNENDPFLYGQRIKAFLQKGASRDFLIEYPNNIWGYGILSLCTTMDLLVEYAGG
ncbi:MAG: S8 family peptidase [Anaerotignaceae bacterium]